MNKKIENIHLIIGFSLLFLVPITARIDEELCQVVKYLALGYWGLISILFFIKLLDYCIKTSGLRNFLFNLWLFLSIIVGIAGVSGIIFYGLDDVPWAILLVIYALIIGYIHRNKLTQWDIDERS
jgi:hypothetical protein